LLFLDNSQPKPFFSSGCDDGAALLVGTGAGAALGAVSATGAAAAGWDAGGVRADVVSGVADVVAVGGKGAAAGVVVAVAGIGLVAGGSGADAGSGLAAGGAGALGMEEGGDAFIFD